MRKVKKYRFWPGHTWLILSVVCALATSLAGQAPPAPVEVVPVIQRSVAGHQVFTGTILPHRHATIGSAVFGRVIEVNVDVGDAVQAQQPLVRLLTETIALELAAARAELTLRREELAELKNGARPEELRQAEAALVAAEARKNYFDARRQRIASLYQRERATSEEERDEAESASIEATQRYHEALAALELLRAGPRQERIAQAQARVDVQDAVVKRLEDQIQKHTIISRFDGFVTAKHTEVGQWVNRGEHVLDVAELRVVDVMVHVVEEYIANVHVGQEVPVELPALADRAITGHVAAIIPQADMRARTFPVKVRVDNIIEDRVPLLKAGMLARVSLPIGRKRDALFVPKDAVVLGGKDPLVYRLQQSGTEGSASTTVIPVPVKLGMAVDSLVQVDGDLQPGMHVVTLGNERLRAGQAVLVTSSVGTDDSVLDNTTGR